MFGSWLSYGTKPQGRRQWDGGKGSRQALARVRPPRIWAREQEQLPLLLTVSASLCCCYRQRPESKVMETKQVFSRSALVREQEKGADHSWSIIQFPDSWVPRPIFSLPLNYSYIVSPEISIERKSKLEHYEHLLGSGGQVSFGHVRWTCLEQGLMFSFRGFQNCKSWLLFSL